MGQGASFFAGLEAPPRVKPEETAPVGQTALHFPQRMHSGEQEISCSESATGQARSQALQETHRSFFHWICTRLKRLNQP